MSKVTTVGSYIVAISVLFCAIETLYFCSTWGPESRAEWVCDGISLSGVVLGMLMVVTPAYVSIAKLWP